MNNYTGTMSIIKNKQNYLALFLIIIIVLAILGTLGVFTKHKSPFTEITTKNTKTIIVDNDLYNGNTNTILKKCLISIGPNFETGNFLGLSRVGVSATSLKSDTIICVYDPKQKTLSQWLGMGILGISKNKPNTDIVLHSKENLDRKKYIYEWNVDVKKGAVFAQLNGKEYCLENGGLKSKGKTLAAYPWDNSNNKRWGLVLYQAY